LSIIFQVKRIRIIQLKIKIMGRLRLKATIKANLNKVDPNRSTRIIYLNIKIHSASLKTKKALGI